MGRALALLVLLALPAAAHAPAVQRTLKLQASEAALEGLLELRVPPQKARIFSAAALGATGAEARRKVAAAMLPMALEGLVLTVDGAQVTLVVKDARVRPGPNGALELAALLSAGAAPKKDLRLAVGSGAPLVARLTAGVPLRLSSGAGAMEEGALVLRPRPGAPCAVAVGTAKP